MQRVHWKLAFQRFYYISVKGKHNLKQFVYLLFFYFFFVNWSNISFFPIVGKKTCNKWVLENQCKWMNYRVSTNFNRLNWNPIMTMFFIYVESFITSLLPKQIVLIRSFVICDIFAGKILLFGIGEHCFAKKS